MASLGICLDKFAANRAVNMFHGRSPPAVSHNMAAEKRAKRNPYVKISLIAVKCNVGSSPKKSQNLENSI